MYYIHFMGLPGGFLKFTAHMVLLIGFYSTFKCVTLDHPCQRVASPGGHLVLLLSRGKVTCSPFWSSDFIDGCSDTCDQIRIHPPVIVFQLGFQPREVRCGRCF